MDSSSLSRRTLLKTVGAVAASASLPTLLSAQNPVSRPIIGRGEHTYEVFHDWLVPPSNIKWGDTQGLTTDSQGRIYVAHTVHPTSVKTDAIVVFDAKGKFVESWGSEYKGGAHGLDLRKEGSEEFLYHCDTARRKVIKTDLRGKVVWERGVPTESGVYPDANKWCPTNVAFAPDGDLFVGDGYGSHYIVRYSKDGAFKGVVVSPGTEAGRVREPHGLWVDDRGVTPRLVVADRGNRRLQYFTLEGQHLFFINEGMRQPCHLHFNHGLMLVPDLQSVVTILDSKFNVAAALGDGAPTKLRGAPRDQFVPGKFIHPHAAIWSNPKDIIVAEWVPDGRITMLRKVH